RLLRGFVFAGGCNRDGSFVPNLPGLAHGTLTTQELNKQMEGQLWFTALLNRAFAGPVNAVLQSLPPAFHPADPAHPISNYVAMEVLVILILLVLFVVIRSRLSVDKPGGLQHLTEFLNEFITNQSREIIGEHSERFTPFLSALFLFVLASNLIGLIPSLESAN